MDYSNLLSIYGLKLGLCFIISLVLGLVIYPFLIPLLKKLRFGQHVRDDLPEEHKAKEGVPTMGGILFLIVPVLVCLLVYPKALDNPVIMIGYIGFGLIGLLDDILIIIKKNSIGLKTLEKLALQIIVSVIIIIIFNNKYSDTTIFLPIKDALENSYKTINLGWAFSIIIFIMLTGETNAVNLTDGLDGLCAGLMLFALVPVVLFSTENKGYLSIDQCFLLVSVMGILVAYLFFNHHPAKIFMGDTGSLALGGLLSTTTLLAKQEIALLIIGFIFLVEVTTAAIQIYGIRVHHGKRYFKMAPFHHHLEKCGWKETKIVKVYYLIGIVGSIIGVYIALLVH